MAFAEYFDRAALAAAQVVAGFREDDFRALLEQQAVGVAIDAEAADSSEGRALADLLIRLFARLYPRLAIIDGPGAGDLRALAARINPRITFDATAEIGVVIGRRDSPFTATVYAGSDGWTALISRTEPQPLGTSALPFGAGAAACLAAANVFRCMFIDSEALDPTIAFSTYSGEVGDDTGELSTAPLDLMLVGLGAVGHGAVWALAHSPLEGTIRLVDHEKVELSNLQRYVLTELDGVGADKAAVIAAALQPSGLAVASHTERFARFVASRDERRLPAVAVALDSARDRRQVQASLPRFVFNAWTQPGDLGVSVHGRFGSTGACLACLYLQSGQQPNEDEIVASALGVPERQQQVRLLLADGAPPPPDLLEAIAQALEVAPEVAAAWQAEPLRDLYVRGLCGGALVPLSRLGQAREDVHVPLAHQSALAGVLLAAQVARFGTEQAPSMTEVIRIDLMRPLGVAQRQPNAANSDGRCICRDADFIAVYDFKHPQQPRRPLRSAPTRPLVVRPETADRR